jgi:hypothetical protein
MRKYELDIKFAPPLARDENCDSGTDNGGWLLLAARSLSPVFVMGLVVIIPATANRIIPANQTVTA